MQICTVLPSLQATVSLFRVFPSLLCVFKVNTTNITPGNPVLFSNNGLFSKTTLFLIYFNNWQATEWGKMLCKGWKKGWGRGQRGLCYNGNVNTKIATSMYCECQSVEMKNIFFISADWHSFVSLGSVCDTFTL